MYKAFRGFEKYCVIAPVSPWTESRAREADILQGFSFCTVYNGIDAQNIFYCREEKPAEQRIVLNVTAHFSPNPDHAKGGYYLIRLAEKMPEVEFWVAGKSETRTKLPDNLKLLGEIRDQQELASLYRKAQLSILVSQRETFSMPCAESLCCGTPVVGFKAGAPEQIALPEYSEFVEFGDMDALERTVRRWLERQDIDSKAVSMKAFEQYSAQAMIRAYVDIYGRLLWS
jgi:glycosyltransferase involved in cell wall biosynthesis